jgi:hypothetical protein
VRKNIGRLGAVFICVLFLATAFASIPAPAEPQSRSVSRVVLTELFTATWCGACPSAVGAMDRLADDTNYFPDKIAMIQWHANDAYSDSDHSARLSYYSISGVPTAMFDGVGSVVGGGSNCNNTAVDNAYKSEINNRPTTADVDITVTKSLNGNSGSYDIDFEALASLTGTLQARAVLVEDINASHGCSKYRWTARKVLEDQSISISSNGDNVTLSGTFTNTWDKYKIGIVAWVQNEATKEVLQAAVSLFPGNKPPKILQSDLDFSMNEDTIDDHIDLDNVFQEPEGETMTFFIESLSSSSHISFYKDADNVLVFTPEADWYGDESFKITADDPYQGNAKSVVTLTVTVDPVNDGPFVENAIKDFSMQEGATDKHITLNNVFTDIEGDVLTYGVTGEDLLDVSISSASSIVTIKAADGVFGSETLTFSATDGEFEVTEEAKVTIKHVNHQPEILAPIDDFSMDEDTVREDIDLDDVFNDFDEDTLFFDVSGNVNIVVSVITDNILRIEPMADWNGQETITISCTDNMATPISEDVTITVDPVNDAPELIAELEEIEFDEDTEFESDDSLADVFTDVDGDLLIFDMLESENIEIDIDSDGTFVLTPAENFNGEEELVFTAYDGIETTNYNFTIVVEPVNDPVVIESVSPEMDTLAMMEGKSQDFSIVATDVDGDIIEYTWYLDGMPVETLGTDFTYDADYTSAGSHKVKIIVSDSKTEAEFNWKINVQDVNRKPVVEISSPTSDGIYKDKDVISMEANLSDEDTDDKLTITWYVDGQAIPNSNKDKISQTLTPGAHTIKVSVSDGKEASFDEVTITVKKKSGGGNTPGFEAVFLIAALGVAFILARRKL